MKILEVTWVDSMILQHGEWDDIAEYRELFEDEAAATHKSIGYLISTEEDEEMGVLIAGSLSPDETRAAGVMFIPKQAILDRRDVAL